MSGWRDQAACLGHDPEPWFADTHHGEQRAFALTICHACPVREACLNAALTAEGSAARHQRSGLFGGLTPAQRARMPRADTPDREQCGTAAKARAHQRAGEPVCRACRAARNAYRRDRAAKARTAA